jgi:hypothetical protein
MTDEPEPMMRQQAPFPEPLRELVGQLTYRPGWTFTLIDTDRGQGSVGLTLDIVTSGYNSYHPERGPNYRVHHYMLVPPADRKSVVYAPNHGPGNDPYIVAELASTEDRDTSFRGVRNTPDA